MTEEAAFRFTIPGQEVPPDSLGVWQTEVADAQAFGAGAEQEATLWDIDLPQSPSLAAGALDLQLKNMQLSQAALPYANQRLDQFVSGVTTGGVDWGESFAAGEESFPAAEGDLYQFILTEQAEDFASLRDIQKQLGEASQQLASFSEQVRTSLAHFAHVKTRSGGVELGSTHVAWLGDVRTAWGSGLSSQQAGLHQRALQLALGSRQAWLRLAMHIASGGVKLATLLTGPGALFALPAAYRFFTQVMADVRQIRDIRKLSV